MRRSSPSSKSGWTVESKIFYGFAGFFVLLILIGTSSIYSVQRFSDPVGWVAHTNTVIFQLEQNSAFFDRTLAAHRGYLITGQASYLVERDQQFNALQAGIGQLIQFVSDNPVQQQRLERLQDALKVRQGQ